MSSDPTPVPLTVDVRRAAFRALVAAQDAGLSVPASRADVARRFALTEEQVVHIEREGLENDWPPLG